MKLGAGYEIYVFTIFARREALSATNRRVLYIYSIRQNAVIHLFYLSVLEQSENSRSVFIYFRVLWE